MPNILKKADELVNGERNRDYGPPEEDFATTSELWEVVRKRIETEEPIHVPIRMILLKISRILNGDGKLDNWTDIAGYAQTGATIQFGTLPTFEELTVPIDKATEKFQAGKPWKGWKSLSFQPTTPKEPPFELTEHPQHHPDHLIYPTIPVDAKKTNEKFEDVVEQIRKDRTEGDEK